MIHTTAVLIKNRVRGINGRARKAGVLGRITRDDLQQILMNADVACPQCDTTFGFAFRDRWTYCFTVSLFGGGDNTPENGSILCRRCEMQRATAMGVRALRAHRPRRAIGMLHGHATRLDSGTVNAGSAFLAADVIELAASELVEAAI